MEQEIDPRAAKIVRGRQREQKHSEGIADLQNDPRSESGQQQACNRLEGCRPRHDPYPQAADATPKHRPEGPLVDDPVDPCRYVKPVAPLDFDNEIAVDLNEIAVDSMDIECHTDKAEPENPQDCKPVGTIVVL